MAEETITQDIVKENESSYIPFKGEFIAVEDNNNIIGFKLGDGKTPFDKLEIFYNKKDMDFWKQDTTNTVITLNQRVLDLAKFANGLKEENGRLISHINAMKLAYKFKFYFAYSLSGLAIILLLLLLLVLRK